MKKSNPKPSECPSCKEVLFVVNPVDTEALPSIGDLTVCSHCLTILTFGKDMKHELLSEEAFEKLPPETQDDVLYAKSLIIKALVTNT